MTLVYFAKQHLILFTQFTIKLLTEIKVNATIQFQTLDDQLDFEDSRFPRMVTKPSCVSNLADSVSWVTQNINALEKELDTSGVVLFRGFPITDAESFDEFSAAFKYSNFTYKESLSNAVRVNFTERVFTANEAPSDVEIYLHHEMAQTPVSPDKLFFYCKAAAQQGGATPVCRSDELYKELQQTHPHLAKSFKEKGLKYTTSMPIEDNHQSGQGRSWKSTLSVETKSEAEQKLTVLGYDWVWLEDGSLRAITPVLPAVIELDNGKSVFYNQLIAAYMGWQGVKDNPSKAICFGDDSPIAVEGLKEIVALSKKHTYDLNWQDGDVALVDNKMVMHGRRPYSGKRKREVLVALTI